VKFLLNINVLIAVLRVRKKIKMAEVIITLKIMPESPETELSEIEKKAIDIIENYEGEVGKVEIEPIAFGLKALKLSFVMDESKGFNEEELLANINKIEGVSSSEVIDVRRAIG